MARKKCKSVPSLERESGSWVVTSPKGRVVELFDRANVEKACAAGWRVETALQYLTRIRAEVKRPMTRQENDAGSFAIGAAVGAGATIISNIVRGSPGVRYVDLIVKAEKQIADGNFGEAEKTLKRADEAREKAVKQAGGINDNIELGDKARPGVEARVHRGLAARQENGGASESELVRRLKF